MYKTSAKKRNRPKHPTKFRIYLTTKQYRHFQKKKQRLEHHFFNIHISLCKRDQTKDVHFMCSLEMN